MILQILIDENTKEKTSLRPTSGFDVSMPGLRTQRVPGYTQDRNQSMSQKEVEAEFIEGLEKVQVQSIWEIQKGKEGVSCLLGI